jgi:multimeric flavodoxin WrbA
MTPLNLKGLSLWADYKTFGDPLQVALDAFIAEAVKKNHEIFRHDFKGLKIKECQDCGGCFTKEVPCAYLDDFNLVAPDLLKSHDLVIFAEGSFSGPLKAALSKTRVFESAPKKLKLHKAYLVYLGSEKELQNEIRPYFEGVFALSPESTKVIRYEKAEGKALAELVSLADRL